MKIYACIDLKSFYASVECVKLNLDPLTTNLVVADLSRTEKTICLAVSPSLKEYKIPGRARLYEVISRVKEINFERLKKAKKFTSKSTNIVELKKDIKKELDFIVAKPKMNDYIKVSTQIYNIYLKYVSIDDILVYSIDEVFLDITNYLKYYKLSARELVTKIIKDVYLTTGITATAGIGTNMYLAKVAMDIVAKKMKANEFGVRLAGLDEKTYRKLLWGHTPITDFWRVGEGYSKRLEKCNIYTMGDIARCSINNEKLLYDLFGVNAETLIDHAWGYESVSIKDAKSYAPLEKSLSIGQVLHAPYDFEKTKLIVKEMCDNLCLDLVDKNLVTNKLTLTIGYDIENIKNGNYNGEIVKDRYNRIIPKHTHFTCNINIFTSSSKIIIKEILKLYEKEVNKNLLIRRVNLVAANLKNINEVNTSNYFTQTSLFDKEEDNFDIDLDKENKAQKAILEIKKKYGKNAIVKAMDLEEGATTIKRNNQVGGHNG